MKVKLTINTGSKTVTAESKPGHLTVRTVWSLDKEDEWQVTENMKKLPGMAMFVSTDGLPGEHALIFDEIKDGLITIFARLELHEKAAESEGGANNANSL